MAGDRDASLAKQHHQARLALHSIPEKATDRRTRRAEAEASAQRRRAAAAQRTQTCRSSMVKTDTRRSTRFRSRSMRSSARSLMPCVSACTCMPTKRHGLSEWRSSAWQSRTRHGMNSESASANSKWARVWQAAGTQQRTSRAVHATGMQGVLGERSSACVGLQCKGRPCRAR